MTGPLIFAAAATTDSPNACGGHTWVCRQTLELTENGDVSRFLDKAAIVLLILVLGWLVQRITRRLIKRSVQGLQGEVVQRRLSSIRRRTPKALLATNEHASLRRVQRAETIGALLRSASTVIVVVGVFIAVLGQFSLPLGSFVASASVATAALVFGAQNIVRDFLAGLFIVVEDQYGVGDVIDVGAPGGGSTPISGVIESVSLRTTRLRGADGTVWHVPNGEIKRVGNMSQQWSRAVIDFNIAVEADVVRAKRIIKRTADDLWRDSAYAGIIIEEPEIWGPESINENGVLIKLAVKTLPLEQWDIARTFREKVKEALDDADIGWPWPRFEQTKAGEANAGETSATGTEPRVAQMPANEPRPATTNEAG